MKNLYCFLYIASKAKYNAKKKQVNKNIIKLDFRVYNSKGIRQKQFKITQSIQKSQK